MQNFCFQLQYHSHKTESPNSSKNITAFQLSIEGQSDMFVEVSALKQ